MKLLIFTAFLTLTSASLVRANEPPCPEAWRDSYRKYQVMMANQHSALSGYQSKIEIHSVVNGKPAVEFTMGRTYWLNGTPDSRRGVSIDEKISCPNLDHRGCKYDDPNKLPDHLGDMVKTFKSDEGFLNDPGNWDQVAINDHNFALQAPSCTVDPKNPSVYKIHLKPNPDRVAQDQKKGRGLFTGDLWINAAGAPQRIVLVPTVVSDKHVKSMTLDATFEQIGNYYLPKTAVTVVHAEGGMGMVQVDNTSTVTYVHDPNSFQPALSDTEKKAAATAQNGTH